MGRVRRSRRVVAEPKYASFRRGRTCVPSRHECLRHIEPSAGQCSRAPNIIPVGAMGPLRRAAYLRQRCPSNRSAMDERFPTNRPLRIPFGSPRIEPDLGAAGCWRPRRHWRHTAPTAVVSSAGLSAVARRGGLGADGQTGSPVKGPAIVANRRRRWIAAAAALTCGVIGLSLGVARSGSSSAAAPVAASTSAGSGGSSGGAPNARSGPAAGGASGTVATVSSSGFIMTTSAGQNVTVDCSTVGSGARFIIRASRSSARDGGPRGSLVRVVAAPVSAPRPLGTRP